MKILAIRGKNLASLYGKFDLRLDQPPVSSFGLFSISGPTGSGKSTLLDALCLALYGRTPRLTDDGGHVIGAPGDDDKLCLKSNDVRAILSRGTTDGCAEVEFEGVDGKSYIAAWQVRRARGKATGRFQQQSMELRAAATGEILASQLSTACQEIERRVGFTYEEFKRTVLLPQFEFTNFLKARPDDRAKILERVTGGEIFTRLSVAAHERAKTEGTKLSDLNEKLGTTTILSTDERDELSRQLSAAEKLLNAARDEAKQAERDLAWHKDHTQRLDQLDKAKKALTEAELNLTAAYPLAQELAAVIAVQPVRLTLKDAVDSARSRDEDRSAALGADEDHGKAIDAAKKATDALQTKETSLTQAREQLSAVQPMIEEAKRLDQDIANASALVETASAKAAQAARDLQTAKDDLYQVDSKLKSLGSELEAAETWAAQHSSEQLLADEWPRWQADLRRYLATISEIASVASRHGSAAREIEGLRETLAEAKRVLLEKQSDVTKVGAALAKAAAHVDVQQLHTLGERSASARQQVQALVTVDEIAKNAREAVANQTTYRASIEENVKSGQRISGELVRLGVDLEACRARKSEAQAGLRAAEVALSLTEHRARLCDGDPCPLCGSVEHPWAHGDQPMGVLEPMTARIGELERQEKELVAARENAQVASATLESSLTRIRADLEGAVRAAEEAQAKYEACRSRFDGLPDRAEQAPSAITALLAHAEAAVPQAENAEAAALARLRERDKAQLALNRAKAEAESALTEQSRISGDLDRKGGVVAQLDEEHRRLVSERDGMESELAPALCWRGGWVEEARENCDGFLQAVEQQVLDFIKRRRRLEASRADLQGLGSKREAAATLIAERERHHADAVKEHERLKATLEGLAAQRTLTLDGRDANAVAHELEDALARATREQDGARLAREAATALVASAKATRDTAAKRLVDSEARADEANRILYVALAKLAIDRATLEQRLDRSPAWITETQDKMDCLRDAVTGAKATVGERHDQLLEKESQERPTRGPAECEAALNASRSNEESRQAAYLNSLHSV